MKKFYIITNLLKDKTLEIEVIDYGKGIENIDDSLYSS